MGQKKLEGATIEELFLEVSSILKNDKRKKFRALCLNTDLSKYIIKNIFKKSFQVNDQGEFLELFTTYEKYEQEKEVYVYLFFTESLENIILFTLSSSDELYKTMGSLIESTEGIYNLWIPPSFLEIIQEKILDIRGSSLTYFSYENYASERRGLKRKKGEGEYRGDDARSKLEKWKKEDEITPTSFEFKIPPKTNIKINNTGEFILLNKKDIHVFPDNINFFYENLIKMSINEVSEINREIKTSTLDVIKTDTREKLEEKQLHIQLKDPLDYEDGSTFLEQMKSSSFMPYNYTTAEGSLIMEGNIVDKKNGGILSLSSNGERFLLIPKYNTKFDSLLRFFRFLIERVDPNAEIVKRT
ncbi:MAG: hypothetical protein R6U61_04910 [Thermoplasmata archaeon]